MQRPKLIIKWYNPIHFLSMGFGTGLLPVAPGTWGTAIAIPIYLVLRNLPLFYYGAVVLLLFGVGLWLCETTMKALQVYDHPYIVWDEIVGFLITMIAVPHGWYWILLGFVLFRIFDIWKPWPIRWFDQNVRNGIGIMVDDLVAALYAGIVLKVIVILGYHFLKLPPI